MIDSEGGSYQLSMELNGNGVVGPPAAGTRCDHDTPFPKLIVKGRLSRYLDHSASWSLQQVACQLLDGDCILLSYIDLLVRGRGYINI